MPAPLDEDDIALRAIALLECGPEDKAALRALSGSITAAEVAALLGSVLGLFWDLGQQHPEIVERYLAEHRALIVAGIERRDG